MTEKTLDQMAGEIAIKANECCYRADGYEEDIKALALSCLKDAYEQGRAESPKQVAACDAEKDAAMNEMIERAALALFEELRTTGDTWEGKPDTRKEFYRACVCKIFEVMREPTEAMIRRGARLIVACAEDAAKEYHPAKTVFIAMIDEALK